MTSEARFGGQGVARDWTLEPVAQAAVLDTTLLGMRPHGHTSFPPIMCVSKN